MIVDRNRRDRYPEFILKKIGNIFYMDGVAGEVDAMELRDARELLCELVECVFDLDDEIFQQGREGVRYLGEDLLLVGDRGQVLLRGPE